MDFFFIITSLLKIVGILFVVILPMVSYSVYAERRVSAFIQDRPGPNRVGPAGLFQPIADLFKLLLKEDFTPRSVNTFYYCRSRSIWQHTFRRAHGDRRRERGYSVRFRHRVAWRLRDRHCRMGVEFQVSISRRHSFEFANDFV